MRHADRAINTEWKKLKGEETEATSEDYTIQETCLRDYGAGILTLETVFE
jgi:hypothetical protein